MSDGVGCLRDPFKHGEEAFTAQADAFEAIPHLAGTEGCAETPRSPASKSSCTDKGIQALVGDARDCVQGGTAVGMRVAFGIFAHTGRFVYIYIYIYDREKEKEYAYTQCMRAVVHCLVWQGTKQVKWPNRKKTVRLFYGARVR